jgi:NADH-quinone oxidoreductase subunit F
VVEDAKWLAIVGKTEYESAVKGNENKQLKISLRGRDMARKVLLDRIGIEGIRYYDGYRKNGGYSALEKAFKMSPEQVTDEVKKSGLRGRGGAGFPTGMKWGFLAKPEGVPRYLVCNADESEPGTFKDRYLMELIPHLLIEGLIISSYAIGSKRTYIYIRGEFAWIVDILEQAISEAKNNGWLGKNILGSGFDCEIYVHRGAGAYICGEETALIESLEGKRGYPRIKPPFPAVRGLWDCPTVVNNVETLAAVVPIITMGGEEYAKIGIGKSTGTKLISACGNIKRPGVYEIEMNISVEEFIFSDEYCGGMANGRRLKACIPGGSSVPILPANLLLKTAKGQTRMMTYESLSDGGFQTGSMMGSGGFIVLNEDQCVVKNTLTFARFYRHESCGQCSPCREGTGWMEKILHSIEYGKGKMSDIDLLWDIQSKIEGNTICPLGDAAAWPVAAAIRHFRDEFEWHVTNPDDAQGTNYGLGNYAQPLEVTV